MHMADALISPIVGGAMYLTSGGIATNAIRKIQDELDEKKIPLMGVMGALVFASQMINFAIPGTGSSGHIGGGLLLAIVLGPYAGFLTIASILLIQTLFFGDGGLLAYGANLFNMGFFSCFIAYPFIYRPLTQRKLGSKQIWIATVIAAVIGLQFGAFSVVLETFFSGKTELPFGTFVLLMQPIHLAIGFIEGVVTASIVVFLWKARPEILHGYKHQSGSAKWSLKKVATLLVLLTLFIGGVLSWFASEDPDGLEWSIQKTTGSAEIESQGSLHEFLGKIQARLAFLPDYQFKAQGNEDASGNTPTTALAERAGTSFSGIAGGILTLGLAITAGWGIRLYKRRSANHVKNE